MLFSLSLSSCLAWNIFLSNEGGGKSGCTSGYSLVEAVDFRGNFKRCSLVYLENFENSLYRSKKEVEKFLQIFARYISARDTNIVIIFVMIVDNPPAKGISCLKINGVFVQ